MVKEKFLEDGSIFSFHIPFTESTFTEEICPMALFQQKMMLIYIQNFSVLDWELCCRVKALLHSCNSEHSIQFFNLHYETGRD